MCQHHYGTGHSRTDARDTASTPSPCYCVSGSVCRMPPGPRSPGERFRASCLFREIAHRSDGTVCQGIIDWTGVECRQSHRRGLSSISSVNWCIGHTRSQRTQSIRRIQRR